MQIRKNFLIGSILMLIGIQVVYGISMMFIFSNWQDRGTFGDMFGAVNSLFSGLAFIGVIATILMQQEELRLQREELKLTRAELGRSANAQEAAVSSSAAQSAAAKETAELSTISFLIEHFQRMEDRFNKHTYLHNAAGKARAARERIASLERLSEEKYLALVGGNAAL